MFRCAHVVLLPESRHPKVYPTLVTLWKLSPENELKPALAADRYQVLVKRMVGNPDLRSASFTPNPNRMIPAKLAEKLG
jgi:hypothetical protein